MTKKYETVDWRQPRLRDDGQPLNDLERIMWRLNDVCERLDTLIPDIPQNIKPLPKPETRVSVSPS